jgi:pimeloyl-ACP methyl ester carboxylesterase
VVDAAEDVRGIATLLGIHRFSVVGRSGGGPHALACAAIMPEMVRRTSVLVCFARPDAEGLKWFSGMTPGNTREFAAASLDPLSLAALLMRKAARTSDNPETLLAEIEEEMSEPDQRVVKDVVMRRQILQAYAEALRNGPHGWIDDVLALRHDWGFDLSSIDGPVRLWHGAQDNFAPVSHTRWLAGQIRNSEVLVQDDKAHFGALEILPEILDWLAAA